MFTIFFISQFLLYVSKNTLYISYMQYLRQYMNKSTEGAEFVWVSECQKGEGCEIIKQFVLYSATNAFQRFNCS
jgi:hypothetical protein